MTKENREKPRAAVQAAPTVKLYWKWRVTREHPEAHRIPPWPMTEEEAAAWAKVWGCEVEKIEGTEHRAEPQRAPGK